MAHFLIVDDEPAVRKVFRSWIESEQHTCEETSNVDEAVNAVKKSQDEAGEPFDLILLDHELGGGEKGLDALEEFGNEYCQHRIVVITGHSDRKLGTEYARLGAIGHLLKPVLSAQFWVTIQAALERRAIYIDNKEDWEQAYQLLENLGLVDSINQLTTEANRNIEQYETLRYTYQRLVEDLRTAGNREQEIATAYSNAFNSLNFSRDSIDSIYQFLGDFQITQAFWSDIEDIFRSDRLHFYVLQSYLERIRNNPAAQRTKHLAPGASGHYEYRIGRSFRLYYRREEEAIILERFGHKNIQRQIIDYLSNSNDEIMLHID